MPQVPCSVHTDGDPNEWVSCDYHRCPMAVVLIQHIARCLVLNIAGPACLDRVFPLHPLHSLIWMNGLDVVGSSNVPDNHTPSLFLAFVLHVMASSFCSTLGNWWSGRPLHPVSARSQPCTGQRPVLGVHHFVPRVCRSQWSASALQHGAGLCTFAAGVRRPLFTVGICDPLLRFLFTKI